MGDPNLLMVSRPRAKDEACVFIFTYVDMHMHTLSMGEMCERLAWGRTCRLGNRRAHGFRIQFSPVARKFYEF